MAALAEASRQLEEAAAEALAEGRFEDLERLAAALRCLSTDHPTPTPPASSSGSGGVLRQIAAQLAPQPQPSGRDAALHQLHQPPTPLELSPAAGPGSAGKQVCTRRLLSHSLLPAAG